MRFAESPGQIIDNVFDFIEYLQWKYIFSNNNFGVRILSKTGKRMIFSLPNDNKHRSTQFLICTAVFLCREFRLENICSGVKLIFVGKCSQEIFFAATYFCWLLKKLQKSQKLERAKILCHTVWQGYYRYQKDHL